MYLLEFSYQSYRREVRLIGCSQGDRFINRLMSMEALMGVVLAAAVASVKIIF